MKQTTANRAFALGLLGVMSLATLGCSAQDGTASSAAPAAENTVPADTANEDRAPEPEFDAATCLHGSWLADNAHTLATMQDFGGEPTSVAGEVVFTFSADGSHTTQYNGWRIAMLTEGIETVITREGVDQGEYTTAAGLIDIQETNTGSVLTVSTAGVSMPVTPEAAVYISAEYTCDEAAASITTPDGVVALSRLEG